MIRIHCVGGATFTGRTIDTIARREFGAKAFYRPFQNPNEPAAGQILVPTRHDPRAYWVGATVMQIEEHTP